MSHPWRLGSAGVAIAAALHGPVACSGAGNPDLLSPPRQGTTSPSGTEDASSSKPEDATVTEPSDDAESEDAQSSGDDSSEPGSPDAAMDTGATPPPGAEPISPCPACALGTTCCSKAGSTQYGMCYSAALCFGLCCN